MGGFIVSVACAVAMGIVAAYLFAGWFANLEIPGVTR